TSAFAASGFEFLFQLAGGVGATIPNKEAKDLLGIKGSLSVDADVSAQIGYMFQVKDGFGISVLGELGYSWDAYLMGYGSTGVASGGGTYSAENGLDMSLYYHSFKLGLLPKFNIGVGRGAIALGIGGGVKIPVAGGLTTTVTIAGNYPTSEAAKTQTDITLTRQDITDMFSPSVIGYVKVTFDYYLFFTDNIGMNFGLYLGGDFAPKQKETKIGC
ncbi:hypothetical protein, partial [Brachyspira catarrhinii]|uniref:hypothetical protein n=1 Tax=Brachyspira catarrhinii TaxID=2528966 RepID=UPI001386FC16